MKKKSLKLIVGTLIIGMIGGGLAGCGSSNDSGNATSSNTEAKAISISGSSALLPLMESSKEGFESANAGYQVNAQAGGSGTGLSQVLEGSVDIGNSDIFANEKLDEEQAKELVDHQVVAQGFGVVVNKDLGVNNLTKQQIKDIFSGKITNWKDVGGKDKEIFVIHRPASSGTRATFAKTILDGDKSLENDSIGATQDSNGAVLTAMQQNEGAISYLALSYMNSDEAKSKLETISIDGVSCDKENIETGKYGFWSWGHMYTKGEPNDASKKFIDYIMSDANKENVENLGFISGSDMKVK